MSTVQLFAKVRGGLTTLLAVSPEKRTLPLGQVPDHAWGCQNQWSRWPWGSSGTRVSDGGARHIGDMILRAMASYPGDQGHPARSCDGNMDPCFLNTALSSLMLSISHPTLSAHLLYNTQDFSWPLFLGYFGLPKIIHKHRFKHISIKFKTTKKHFLDITTGSFTTPNGCSRLQKGIFLVTWVNLKGILLNDRSQTQRLHPTWFLPKTFWKRQKYRDRSHSSRGRRLATARHWGVLGDVPVVLWPCVSFKTHRTI